MIGFFRRKKPQDGPDAAQTRPSTAELAAAFNLPAAPLPGLMARFLPVIVDQLSPDGTFDLPERSAA